MAQNDNFYVFEKLDVYQVAKSALVVVIRNRANLRGLPGEISSQLERAAVSTVANIAEATGRSTPADRRNRFVIARGEANEAGAMVELAALYGRFAEEDYRLLRSYYQRVTYMLTALMR